MFIAIIGTRSSGKSVVKDYLVEKKQFRRIHLLSDAEKSRIHPNGTGVKSTRNSTQRTEDLLFTSTSELLTFVTKNWRTNFVTMDLQSIAMVEVFVRRPFFLLMSVDAPLYHRFQRCQQVVSSLSLEQFIHEDDQITFGVRNGTAGDSTRPLSDSSLSKLNDLINVRVINEFQDLEKFHKYLDQLDLLNPRHLRPEWDAYFMTLASLASRRSNCMKRRVGAVLVRDNRILATGYNGTPRGIPNCNEGGCRHCNSPTPSSQIPYECVCLHAEENALLEAGRERVGKNAVLYCNTCPCLKCTIKIIQVGVTTVVYNLSYKVDDASAALFKHAGVELRKYDPNQCLHVPTGSAEQREALLPEVIAPTRS